MIMHNKILLASILSLFVCAVLNAFDYGAELSNAGGYNYSGSASWYTDQKETLWVSIPLDSANRNSLAIEASAYAAKPVGATALTFFADIDLFRFSLLPLSSGNTIISLDAGRIPVSDTTGLILNQSVDGAELHGSFRFGNIDFLAGYTGLQNVRKNTTLMTDDDYADANTTKVYATGASRVVGKCTIQIPQLIGNTDLIVEGVGQYDLRRYLQSSYTSVVDTAYGTLQLSGPVQNNLFYSLSGTWQSGVLRSSGTYSENSLIAALRFDFFPVARHQIFAQASFSPSGNSFFSTFLPVTYQRAGILYADTAGYANLLRIAGGWYFSPLEKLNIDAGGKVFVHMQEETPGAGLYDSTEISAGATAMVTNDLKLRLDSVFLIPAKTAIQSQVSLKVIFDL
jgi:hypothetical protein